MMKKILVILFLIASYSLSAQTIEHFEPSSWWIGMKNPKVQVLVHGNNISQASVSVNYTGVKLLKINKVENPNYLFLDLQIATTAKPGTVKFNFLQKNGEKVSQDFQLLARKPNAAQRKSYDNSDVIYLITPDRFANGNLENDNLPNYPDKLNRSYEYGRHGGDIAGIRTHLDYISDMGFTALWPMPLEENNMKEQSYHGYAITDFYKIDPRFGSNEDYKKLSQEANAKGIKLIRDVILNHCGSEHWWMQDLPSKDWINNDGKFTSTNHQREAQHDPYAAKADLEKLVQGWFVPSMPDMNQRNPFMANYLIQNTIWWIEYADLAGLRIDTYPYSEKAFLTRWTKAVLVEYPNLNMVGEEWSTNQIVTSYWQKGMKNADGYVSYLPTVMDFPLQNAMIEGLKEDDKQWGKGMLKIYQCLSNDNIYANPNNLLTFCDNHDMNRYFTQLNEDKNLYKMGLAMLFTMRGIPQYFYGTELGFASPKERNDGKIRADMPGGWIGDASNVFENKNLNPLQQELLEFNKRILNWRKIATAIHSGKLTQFAPENGLYSYFRYNEKEKYWIIFNKNSEETTVDLKRYKELLPENPSFFDVLENKAFGEHLSIPAKGFRILRVK
ncbi:glycoside hydrolase family 13 protein [Lacihabitans sp. LS3-19]|uniref:glycoside hydrolase family 13 protein n=1 Tax=Lacihabitans sp. LS3-19 TaxID=2487335 RepID=UPI0020CD7835|nr:glycoside hydrolase family 13 protein [Lacihabitans sp. LS3-19]